MANEISLEDFIILYTNERRSKEQLKEFLESKDKEELINFIIQDKDMEEDEENGKRDEFEF